MNIAKNNNDKSIIMSKELKFYNKRKRKNRKAHKNIYNLISLFILMNRTLLELEKIKKGKILHSSGGSL